MLIIKRILIVLFLAIYLLPTAAFAEEGEPLVSARAACVLCHGKILYGKMENLKLPMASTTKLMTAIIVLENCFLDESVKIASEDCSVEGSSMYLKAEKIFSVEDLLKGLLLVSGNDAAKALARHCSGTEEDFVFLMNNKAKELGMKDTHFCNPHGLSSREHYSTAYDMALLMEYCLKNDRFRELSSKKYDVVDGLTLQNHNKLLYSCPGCSGGKTGYTEASGRCLVSSCIRDGMELVCVTLSAPDDWNDHILLYECMFEEYEIRSVTEGLRFCVPIISDTAGCSYAVPSVDFYLPVKKSSKVEVSLFPLWNIFTPIKAGEYAAKALVAVDGETAGEYYLVHSEDISE